MALGTTAEGHLVMLAWYHRAMFWPTSLQAGLREPMRLSVGDQAAPSWKRRMADAVRNRAFRTAVGTAASKHSSTPPWQNSAARCPTSSHFASCLYRRRVSKPRRLRPFGPAVVAVSCEVLVGRCGLASRANVDCSFDGRSGSRQLWMSNHCLVRIGAWCSERTPLGGAVLATQRVVAGKLSRGVCASFRAPTFAVADCRLQQRYVQLARRSRVNAAPRLHQRCHAPCFAGV